MWFSEKKQKCCWAPLLEIIAVSVLGTGGITESLSLDANAKLEQYTNSNKKITVALHYTSSLQMTRAWLREKIKSTLDFAFAKNTTHWGISESCLHLYNLPSNNCPSFMLRYFDAHSPNTWQFNKITHKAIEHRKNINALST